MKVTSLNIYPVKSFRGFKVSSAIASDRGFMGDRRWILVDQNGIAITQRQVPQLALLQVEDHGKEITLVNRQNGELISFQKESYSAQKVGADVFGAVTSSNVVSEALNDWISHQIGRPSLFLYMPDEAHRRIKDKYQDASNSTFVGFADSNQYLLTTESSLADLSKRVGSDVEMGRFRPNIVVDGLSPFEEDNWKTLAIGDVIFQFTKPCGRCKITTTDQKTGEVGNEPLKTLSKFRKFGSNVHFGIYLKVPLSEIGKSIEVGDVVKVLE